MKIIYGKNGLSTEKQKVYKKGPKRNLKLKINK